ncbi:MAG TPA: Hsp20/alpha crystallin family protein [Gemmatimonadales bacterium]|nr:Hsp20/alpha crystallin family protein [Gemmatimonadales bacterium]
MVAITRRETTPNLFGLQRLNRILDEAFAGLPFPEQGGNILTANWVPATDISEDANTIQVTMELAGVEPDDVRISLENNVLTVRGEKRQEEEENDDRVYRVERIYGMFQRTFVLPNTVEPERIEAQYENGVLRVRIPKAERARPREIPVNFSASGASKVKTTGQSQGAVGQGSQATGGQTTQGTETPAGNGGEQQTSSSRRAQGSRSGTEGSRGSRR